MKQKSFAITGFELITKRTRKREFLDEMELVGPWVDLVALIEPHTPSGKTGRPPFAVATMLRIHFMQQWFGLSDPAMEVALHDVPLYREFARLDAGITRLPDESTILRFRHLLEEHQMSLQLLATINATLASRGLMLKAGTVVDATLTAAPSSTRYSTGQRDPEMRQAKTGNQWHFGMKAHIGMDADSGLVHTVIGPPANVNDATQGNGLLDGKETAVFADTGYQGARQRVQATGVHWHVAMHPGKRRALDKHSPWGSLLDRAEQIKASMRAKVEHPFRVITCQFGFTKVHCKGLAKNTAQLVTLFSLSNLWMAKRPMLAGAPK